MKKLVTIFMILLFGLSSSGATVQLHYCCGKLKNISLGHIKDDCQMMGKMGSKPCCETKSITAKDKSNDHEVYVITLGVHAPAEQPVLYHDIAPPAAIVQPRFTTVETGSPPLAKDITLLNCVFRI